MKRFHEGFVLNRTRWTGHAVALAAVALVSVLIGLVMVRFSIANISMVYLIAVLASATAFGSGPAVLASAAAFLAFNFFFVEPRYTFTVANPGEWIALLLFLVTATITGQLAAGQRQRAQEAEQREREAVILYDAVRLMSEPDLDQALHAVAERLRHELKLAATAVEIADDRGLMTTRVAVGEAEALQLVQAAATAPVRVLGEGPTPTMSRPGAPGRWVRMVPPRLPRVLPVRASDRLHVVPVKAQAQRVGALLLVRRPGLSRFTRADDRLLSAVTAQIGLAIERTHLRREATEAEALRRTDELKSALLNAVSHDLRTPLAAIIAAAGSLRQQDVAWTEHEQQEFTEAIEQEARRLNRIVGNLLDLSRLEAGSLRPEKGWYDLGALVDDVLGRLRPVTTRHRLVLDVPDELPPVPLDYVEIDQVLSNLIENATKYTSPGAEIELSARAADREVQIEVADRGPGIPATALPRLFQPFYRVDGGGLRPKGTGLGLAVAKGLVEAHGGRIWAENRHGGGARFMFTLPLAALQAAALATGKGEA